MDVFTSENLYPVPGVQLVRRGPIVNSAIVGEEWKKKIREFWLGSRNEGPDPNLSRFCSAATISPFTISLRFTN